MAEQTKSTEQGRAKRAVRIGHVESAKMDKTLVVRITRRVRHPLYNRFIKRSTKLYAHDEENNANMGDTVKVMATRPMSKNKRWRLVEVVERAK